MNLLDKLPDSVQKAELYYQKSADTSIDFKGWKIKSTETTVNEGYSLRAIEGGRLGFSGSTKTGGIEDLIESTLQSCRIGEKIDLQFPAHQGEQHIDVWDESIDQLSLEKIASYGNKLQSLLLELKEDCELEISLGKERLENTLENTSGLKVSELKSVFSISAEISRVKEGDFLFLSDRFFSTRLPEDMDSKIDKLAKNILEQYQYADKIESFTPGKKVPVIFTPKAIPALLLPLLVGINGKNIYSKSSPISDKLGEQIFDPKLSIIDDGTIDHKPKSSAYDDEGFLKRPLNIINNGVLENFLFDLYTAKKAGKNPTGSASRDIFSQPFPSSSNIVVNPGKESYGDMLGGISAGILVEELLGVGQGNILSGAFSNPIGLAYKIENGKIAGRLKNVILSGNIYECMKTITAMSSEQEWWGSIYAPYLQLDTLNITSS